MKLYIPNKSYFPLWSYSDFCMHEAQTRHCKMPYCKMKLFWRYFEVPSIPVNSLIHAKSARLVLHSSQNSATIPGHFGRQLFMIYIHQKGRHFLIFVCAFCPCFCLLLTNEGILPKHCMSNVILFCKAHLYHMFLLWFSLWVIAIWALFFADYLSHLLYLI